MQYDDRAETSTEAPHDAEAERRLEAARQRLALMTLEDTTLREVLEVVVEMGVSTVGGADAASAAIVGGEAPMGTASSPSATAVDGVQDRSGRGPRPYVLERGCRYHGAMDAERDRWPQFSAAALGAGFHTVLALPLLARARTMGALVLYSESHSGFGEADLSAAEALARQSAVTLVNAVSLTVARLTAQHLQDGFVSRELIGQAQGVLMARHVCSRESAFEMLRYWSQSRNQKLRDVAAGVVAEYE